MELTVVSWNLDGWHTIRDTQLRLLDDTGADIALLQEVTPASLQRLRAADWTGNCALELVDADHTERGGAVPRFGCAVLVRSGITITAANLVPGASSPVRALSCNLAVHDRTVTAISAALPPGSMWGRAAKHGQATAIQRELQSAGPPTLLGIDRNGPRHERWDPADTEWWPEDPSWFFDDTAAHGRSDVLDRWHTLHPAVAALARQQRPHGPRAVSYVEQRTDPPTPRRYDLIMTDPDVEVVDVRYRYDDAIAAGSDHGLVVTKLRLRYSDAPLHT